MARSVAEGAKTWSLVSNIAEAGPRAYVLVIGRGTCRAIELPSMGELLIGRDDAADIVLDEPAVSRMNARLIAASGEIRVADLDSHNGTRVNGVPIDGAAALASGDEISIGDAILVVHVHAGRRARAARRDDVRPVHVALGDRQMVLADPAMVRIYELLVRLGPSDLPVLISGETGVGKENAAFAVHHSSSRAAGPFIAINCAAIQENLVESELFGHEKGAFSGATSTKPGLLETAHGGTVFLDEVGELPLGLQAKLLRAIESRRILRIGALRDRDVDFRLVTATNRDLEAEVGAGRFRRDLLYRINVALVEIPPLRERPREIQVLARTFLDEACRRSGRSLLTLSDAALQRLQAHAWPGNVRELRNAMLLVAATVSGDRVQAEDLRLRGARDGAARQATGPAEAEPSGACGSLRIGDELQQIEARRMAEALAACAGVQIRAAALIGMPIRTFTTKMKQYGLTARGDKKPR